MIYDDKRWRCIAAFVKSPKLLIFSGLFIYFSFIYAINLVCILG